MTTAETAWAEAMTFDNRADPYPFFDSLRNTPVAKVAEDTYVVTGYHELLALAHDPRISSDVKRTPVLARLAGEAEPAAKADYLDDDAEQLQAYGHDQSIIGSDPPEHDRARRLLMRYFGPPHSPDLIPNMETGIQRLCSELLDTARNKTRIDVVDEYAYPVPVWAICKILGVPLEDEPKFHAWVFDAFAGVDLGPDAATEEGKARAETARTGAAALKNYMAELIERYLKEPGEGLLSHVVNDDSPDGPMSPQEAVANGMLLLVAGHDSTVNTITHCVLMLLRNPESLQLLRQRPELIPRAIEEVLRMQSAVQFFPTRSATADIQIGGTVIPKGAAVHLMYGAANRDPSRFTNPNQFDPNAPTTSTLAGAAASTRALAVRWHAWRSTSRSRPSSDGCRTRGWWSIRRPIGEATSSAARSTC